MTDLTHFRAEKDQFFKFDDHSPLTAEQKAAFLGLSYYPENPSLQMELEMERLPQPEQVTISTSTGEERSYFHVGQVRFQVNGEPAALQIYEDDYGYFLPFSDASAPTQTYGGGRYLEPLEIRHNILLVDFNLAYNPYCAYNARWSCPLPPAENRLKVTIEAGEKNWPGEK